MQDKLEMIICASMPMALLSILLTGLTGDQKYFMLTKMICTIGLYAFFIYAVMTFLLITLPYLEKKGIIKN